MSNYFEKYEDIKVGWHVIILSDHWCKKIKYKNKDGKKTTIAGVVKIGTLCRVLKINKDSFDLVQEIDVGKKWNVKIADDEKYYGIELAENRVRVMGKEGYNLYLELMAGEKIVRYPEQLCSKCGRRLMLQEYDLGHCQYQCPDGIKVYRMKESWIQDSLGREYRDDYKEFVTDGNGGRGNPVKKVGKDNSNKEIVIMTEHQYEKGDWRD